MTITASIVADSISPEGKRLTTFQLRYPRFIHSEFMTHRLFSRNASSSRAIPVHKMIEDLRRDPAIPVFWGSNKPGMQAGEELKVDDRDLVRARWLDGMNEAIKVAESMIDFGLHKQIANRVLEPWAHINVVVTATEYQNFFGLRSHPDAQPEIKVLSDLMQQEMANAIPTQIGVGQWHLPYIRGSDWIAIRAFCKKNRITRDEPSYDEMAKLAIKVSVARCARVSYLTHDGRETSIEEDMKLHDMLVVATPLHASPAEHQATPDFHHSAHGECCEWANSDLWGNFVGWIQHRKTLDNEFIPG